MINKKLIHFNTYSAFEDSRSQLYDWSIAFIAETKQIYTHGNFYDCDIEDINELNDKIDEILSDIYVDVEYANGVYAVKADGSLVTYDEADESCIGVALIVNDAPTPQHIMIEKYEASNTSYATANDSYESSYDYDYYFSWGGYGTDQTGIQTYSDASSQSAYGHIPLIDGTYFSTSATQLGAYTTWSGNYALNDWNGKANSNVIKTNCLTNGTGSNYYTTMGILLNTFNATPSENQGYTDWYIPACGQFALIHAYTGRNSSYGGNVTGGINEMLTKIGGTTFDTSDGYWSSSEKSSKYGWRLHFDVGRVGTANKNSNGRVRFVRDLSLKISLKDKLAELEQSIPTSTSQLTNDSGYITSNELPTKVSQLENDKNYIENGDSYDSGVYIAVQSGKLINPDEYDSTTETAVGVAVINPKANFIIGLNHTTSIPWGTADQGLYGTDISGLTNHTNSTAAATDMDGVANTDIITAVYSGTDCAAGCARAQSITYGDSSLTGYLGSAGEWQIVLNNHEAVKSAMEIADGNCFQTTDYLYYWTSTEYSSSHSWYAYWNESSDTYTLNPSYKDNYYEVVPFYKIDNETTVLSKINLITTPAGSSTTPIYIDSNGYITASIKYAGGTAITLNGTSRASADTSFYAPTSAGTSGYILTSNGSGEPSWKRKMPISDKESSFTASIGNHYNVYLASDDFTITVPSIGSSAEEINFQINTDSSSRSISFVDSNGSELTQISNEDFTALSANTRYLASVSTDNVILIKAADETIPEITFTMDIGQVYTSNTYLYVTGSVYASQAPSSDINVNISFTYYSAEGSSYVYPRKTLQFPAGSTQCSFSAQGYKYNVSNYSDWNLSSNSSICQNTGFYKGMCIIDNLA